MTSSEIQISVPASPIQTQPPLATWSERYGLRHQLVRIVDFPAGVTAPQKVRIYFRCDHYVLQWWDRAAKMNASERVDGDLVTAIGRARQIEARLTQMGSSEPKCRVLAHSQLVEEFLLELSRRADAGEVAPATVQRYRSALNHYRAFVEQPSIQKAYPHATRVNRDFQLAFAAFLRNRRISANGHPNTALRTMKGVPFVVDTVRALYSWAADPDRGRHLPEGFRNPFLRTNGLRGSLVRDLLGEPDITVPMTVDFLRASDWFQLRLFAPMILYGLRAAEPCFLFLEHFQDGWLKVVCQEGLAYQTKGRRDKRFPVPHCLDILRQPRLGQSAHGLFCQRRGVMEGREKSSWHDASLADLEEEFARRCSAVGDLDAAQRLRIRTRLLQDAAGLTYDHIHAEFQKVSKSLHWPAGATVKDFRHLFSTLLENAGMPEYYRRYFMGQSPGKAAIVTYTHLNKAREHFENAMAREFSPIVQAIELRMRQLGTDRQNGAG